MRDLVASELDLRDRRKRECLVRKAGFPQAKSFEGYGFAQVALPEGYGVDNLTSLEFAKKAQDFVFHGQASRGKTHLAIAIGAACAKAGKEVRFFTADELVLMPTRTSGERRLEVLLKDVAKAELIVIDGLRYVPSGWERVRLLFQVMNDCYESRSLVITTAIEFSKRGSSSGTTVTRPRSSTA